MTAQIEPQDRFDELREVTVRCQRIWAEMESAIHCANGDGPDQLLFPFRLYRRVLETLSNRHRIALAGDALGDVHSGVSRGGQRV